MLLSAFEDGDYIVPVEFHLKEFKAERKNKLYVSVTLGKIKIEDEVKVETPGHQNGEQTKRTHSSSTVSIGDLIKKVNSQYGNFFKYVPSENLEAEQIKSKQSAVNDEKYRLAVMCGEDVTEILKEKADSKGYTSDNSWRMDHSAPKLDRRIFK